MAMIPGRDLPALLLYASMFLIAESRRAVVAVFTEMDCLERRGRVHGVLEASVKVRVEEAER